MKYLISIILILVAAFLIKISNDSKDGVDVVNISADNGGKETYPHKELVLEHKPKSSAKVPYKFLEKMSVKAKISDEEIKSKSFLRFSKQTIEDDDLLGVEYLTSVKHVFFIDSKVTKEAIRHLAKMKSLQFLRFKNVNVTDDCIDTLAKLKLKGLYISDCLITVDGYNTLVKKIPTTEIKYVHENKMLKHIPTK